MKYIGISIGIAFAGVGIGFAIAKAYGAVLNPDTFVYLGLFTFLTFCIAIVATVDV